ncbi:MAG TPA: hypothetical protein VLM79_06915 [Kofleriaceae bacterium]|nr:hypothetical protein [Kofleriaceae bacterium]
MVRRRAGTRQVDSTALPFGSAASPGGAGLVDDGARPFARREHAYEYHTGPRSIVAELERRGRSGGEGVAAQSIGEELQAVLAPRHEIAAAQGRHAPEAVNGELGGVGLRGLRSRGIADRRARLVPGQTGALDEVTEIDVLGDVGLNVPYSSPAQRWSTKHISQQ